MEPARKFKVIVNSKECGTCSGSSPSAVAKKVVKKLCGNSSKVVRFSLKECKHGCERVCGPYQGRMEKLDKPYTRAGKKITHRVVCGKVKKMRGGKIGRTGILDETDFVCDNDEDQVKRHFLTREPYIFFGKSSNDNRMRYVAHNEKINGVKQAIFKVLTQSNNIKTIPIEKVSYKSIDELIDFLDNIRKSEHDFCQTIYNAAVNEKKQYDQNLEQLTSKEIARMGNHPNMAGTLHVARNYNKNRIENTFSNN